MNPENTRSVWGNNHKMWPHCFPELGGLMAPGPIDLHVPKSHKTPNSTVLGLHAVDVSTYKDSYNEIFWISTGKPYH